MNIAILVLVATVASGPSSPMSSGVAPSRIEQAVPAPDGRDIVLVKHLERGEGTSVEVRLPGGVFRPVDEVREIIARRTPRLHPDLESRLPRLERAGRTLRIVVFLRDQPASTIARSVRRLHRDEIGALNQAVRARALAADPLRGTPMRFRDDEVRLSPGTVARSPEQDALMASLDSASSRMRRRVRDELDAAVAPLQTLVESEIRRLGGRVTARIAWLNALAAQVPADRVRDVAAIPEVAAIEADRRARSSLNVSNETMGTPTFWGAGIDGGTFDLGIVDSGIDGAHPALSAQTIIDGVFLATAGNPAWDNTADDVNGHGTHVGGIPASTDSLYDGVAFGLDSVFNIKAGYDLDGADGGNASLYSTDAMDGVDWAITYPGDGADVVNMSYGGSTTSDDTSFARFFDGVVAGMGISSTISAGNSGPGAETVGSPAIAYNILCVANMDDRNTTDRADDLIRISSSRGPTAGGRRKPDITAPGTSIGSCNNNWEGAGSDIVFMTGTSMAAPQVAGALVLLCDAIGTDPLRHKAILLNTAEDRGDTGWDSTFGWGYIDLDHAWTHRNDVIRDTLEPSPDFLLLRGDGFTGDTATLVWHRRVVYNADSYPYVWYSLSDLDLHLYAEGDSSLVASDVSLIDNVHQVTVPADGSVVVKVDVVSASFAGATEEEFALATEEGFAVVDPTLLTVAVTAPSSVAPNEEFTLEADVTNNTGADFHAVNVSPSLPVGFTIESGADPTSLGIVADGTLAQAAWQVRAPGSTGAYSVGADAGSDSYGETFARTDSVPLTVAVGATGSDGIGLHGTAQKTFFLKNDLAGGVADITIRYGGPSLVPLAGDWDGDGTDTIGAYDPVNRVFFLRNSNSKGPADVTFRFGGPGLVPLAGDWDGDGDDTIGVYDPANGVFFLRNANSPGPADLAFRYGGSDKNPVVGDWDGDGDDTVGIYAARVFFLRNTNMNGAADLVIRYGPAGSTPLSGDWNGDLIDTIGAYDPAARRFHLRDQNGAGPDDYNFRFGGTGLTPIAGDWDGS